MYSAILFDLDNTLIDRDAALQSLLESTFCMDKDKVHRLLEIDDHGQGNRAGFSTTWREFGGPDLTLTEFAKAIASRLKPDPALLHNMSELRKLATIGMITNGGSVSQLAKWKAAGLDSVVSRKHLWISQDVGFAKPDARIFQFACDQLHLVAADCLYIGDQPDTDVEAAVRAGMKSQWAAKPLTADDIRNLISRISG